MICPLRRLFAPRPSERPAIPLTPDREKLFMAIIAPDQAQLDRLAAAMPEIDTYVAAKVKAASDALDAANAQVADLQAQLDTAKAATDQAIADHADTSAALTAAADALQAKLGTPAP